MSKRLRDEDEKLKQIKEEEEEVEDRHTIQQRRIYTPLMWKRTSTGFRIEDLKETHFSRVLEIFKEHYMAEDVLGKNTEIIDDEVSVNSYLARLLVLLKAMTTIVAIDENPPNVVQIEEDQNQGEDEDKDEEEKEAKNKNKKEPEKIIAGVLIMRVLNKNEFTRVYSRVKLIEGEAVNKCQRFKNYINRKVDVYEVLKCDSVLRYYDLCILPQYRNNGLGYQMMRCGQEVARTLKVPAVIGLFPNFRLQKLAEKLGMTVLFEIKYTKWLDADGEMIFDDPGAGNYTCALMGGQVPPGSPRILPKPIVEQKERIVARMSRADRRLAASVKNMNV